MIWKTNSSTLKMETRRSSETSVYNKPTWRHIPEDGILHILAEFTAKEAGGGGISINKNWENARNAFT
jgi:hypothetical protein